MLLDIQNRGQLAAGMTAYDADRSEILRTLKDVGTVSEVFRLNHRAKAENLMKAHTGNAAIGHVRYATCGKDDRSYAQPFEREHIHKRKWFSFCFNGQLANYTFLRKRLLAEGDHHLSRNTDTEIILHELGRLLSELKEQPNWVELISRATADFDGAYSLALLTAQGEMIVARDPLGIKPICYVQEGPLFASASESVALLNLGFEPEQIHSLAPGHLIHIRPEGGVRVARFARPVVTTTSVGVAASLGAAAAANGELDAGESEAVEAEASESDANESGANENGARKTCSEQDGSAHCFFEWAYFANVASTLDQRSVYLSRTRLGEELARAELADGRVPLDPEDTIVVPVPDTSKAAADAMAYYLKIPSREGLIRNRYAGRTFIEGGVGRKAKASTKYTPLREVLEGRRVILVEDSIVRSTTMNVLLDRIREQGRAREIHVRVACPPIIAPCFYGIDMSDIDQLIAPKYFRDGKLTAEDQQRLADDLGADTLRYLPVEALSRAIDLPANRLCQACVTGRYPTPCGQELYQLQVDGLRTQQSTERAYELT